MHKRLNLQITHLNHHTLTLLSYVDSIKNIVKVNMISKNKLSFIIGLITVITIISSQTLAGAEEVDACLESEPAIVKIKGKYFQKTFPGPPNYESIKKGDRPETQSILKLDNTICAAITSQEKSWIKWIIRDVKEVTLVFLKKGIYKNEYLMQRVVVTGTLWEAHTAHHRTPLLMTVKNIYLEKEDAP